MKPYNVLIIAEKDNTLFSYKNAIFKDYSFVKSEPTENLEEICEKYQIPLIITSEKYFYTITDNIKSNEFKPHIILLKKNNTNKISFNKQKNKNLYTTIIKSPFDDTEVKQALDHTIAYYNLLKENTSMSNEIKRLENREFSLLKKEVLNNLSHEIRTPLNAIVGFANLLVHRNNIAHKNKEYLSVIEESSNRLVNYIENLSEFLRHENTIEDNTALTFISLYDILQSIHSIFKPIALRKYIVLQLEEIPMELQKIKIKTNKHKIVTIYSKLISSAIYNATNGVIKLGLTKNQGNSICLNYSEKFESKGYYNTLLRTMFKSKDIKTNTLDNELIEITLIKRKIKQLKGKYRFQKEDKTHRLIFELPLCPTVFLIQKNTCKEFG